MEEENLDTLVVTADKIEYTDGVEVEDYEIPRYQSTATRKSDLIHTKLEIAFDWSKQHVFGVATITAKPFFYNSSILELDAKGFDIKKVSMGSQELKYTYDNEKLTINLGKEYNRDQEYTISIDYTAKPNEGASAGSSAITSDKGLFFINPLSDNPTKPQQIWTQGETENSSRWFPTIDKPNERCSQEIYLTVKDKFQTLSNGVLISSVKNSDGTRTDYWKQDKPHAPYLFMLGVGEYTVIEDSWNGLPLMYYVEKPFAADAKAIFNHTPEMLTFFSDKLGYPYPWDKYAQIICRDYVSGAMENTGAVVFGEFVQKTSRELLDGDNDDIVAHEMFHHWFGDLVTCESWSNLTLNEGFATYSEFMWQEYKYGHEAAERKRMQDLQGYLMSAGQGGTHDLIDFAYLDKEDMFDGHSYNKGGLVVHMLRSYVGDAAFYAALKNYLKTNEYSDVEAHELRLAFEDTVGEDLNWFFDQWFFDKGHPVLDINYEIRPADKKVNIAVVQSQDLDENPVFKLPFQVALYYASGKVEYVDVIVDEPEEYLSIDIVGNEMPVVAVLDGSHDVLVVSNNNYTEEDHINLYKFSSEYEDKHNALTVLIDNPSAHDLYIKATQNKAKEIRLLGVSGLTNNDAALLKKLATTDPNSSVRYVSLRKLGHYDTAISVLKNEQSYLVINEALSIINIQNPQLALLEVERLRKGNYKPLLSGMAGIYASTSDPKYLTFFEENINDVGIYAFYNYMSQYGNLAEQASPERMVATAAILKGVAMEESNNYFKKYTATNLINTLIGKLNGDAKTNDTAIKSLSNTMTQIINGTNDTRLQNSFMEYKK